MNEIVSKKIKLYNFAMTMMIVVYHWANFYSMSGADTQRIFALVNLMDLVGYIAMGFFFMMSGFLLYHNANTPQDMINKIKRRCYSLLIPMVLWNTICFAFEFVLHMVGVLPGQWSLLDIANGYTFKMFCGVMWYLLALIMLMIPSPIIINLKKSRALTITTFGVIVAAACVGSWLLEGVEGILYASWFARFLRYWAAYFFGVYAALHHDELIALEKYNGRRAMTVAIPVFVMGVAWLVFCEAAGTWCLNTIVTIVAPIVLWLAISADCLTNLKVSFGIKISFFIYAMHYEFVIPFINALVIPVIKSNGLGIEWMIPLHIGLIVLCYAVILLCAHIMKKVLPNKLFQALSGGRV